MMKHPTGKILISLIVFLFIHNLGHPQDDPPYRLSLEMGGSIEFKVYSLRHYYQGMTYNDRTTLRIHCDTLDSGKHTNVWYMGVKAQDASFYSSYPGRTLDLDYVTLEVFDGGGIDAFNSGELTSGEITLNSSNYTALVEDGDAGNYKVNLTYHLDSVTGQLPGYYNTNFIFKMDTVPFPW